MLRRVQPPVPQPRLQGGVQPIPVRSPSHPPEDEESFFTRAPLTSALIAINVVVFALQVLHAARHASPQTGSLAALYGMPSETLYAFGAGDAESIFTAHRFENLIAATFLHGDIVHIAFNMLVLRQVGALVERAGSATRMLPLYIASGLLSSLASATFQLVQGASAPAVGASGAIMGLIGAALVIGYRIEGPNSRLMRTMARWLLTVILFGIFVSVVRWATKTEGSTIDQAAHIGGALTGAVIAMAWRRGEFKPLTRWLVLSSIGLVLLGTATTVAVREGAGSPRTIR